MFEEILRPFWIERLNTITGIPKTNLIGIIDSKKDYVVYDNIGSQDFSLTVTDYDLFLTGFASDINRFGCAAVESINDIHYTALFKKSHAWKCVKCYYAAYYSVHALLRIFGISCTNFEQLNLSPIQKIADAYSTRNGVTIEKGYYQCKLDYPDKKLICSKIVRSGNKGSHEQLWEVFLIKLDDIIAQIKTKPPSPSTQQAIIVLADLRNNLTYLGSNGGNWLSKVRNEISYKHPNGLWFPYRTSENYFKKIEGVISKWNQPMESVDLSGYIGQPILRFINTSVFLVMLYLTVAKELDKSCTKGNSFQHQGVLSLIRRIET